MRNNIILKRLLNWYVPAVENIAIKPKPTFLSNALTVFLLVLFASIMFSLHGCSSADSTPLGSLESKTDSQKYNWIFWDKEYQKKSTLWNSAVSYCSTKPNYRSNPNCETVNNISIYSPEAFANDGNKVGKLIPEFIDS